MIRLCVLLWPREGRADDLVAYEDQVLRLLPDHGARVVDRARLATGAGAVEGGPLGVPTGAAADDPLEVHLLEFPSEEALAGYMADERRLALADQRDAAIARTQMWRVDLV